MALPHERSPFEVIISACAESQYILPECPYRVSVESRKLRALKRFHKRYILTNLYLGYTHFIFHYALLLCIFFLINKLKRLIYESALDFFVRKSPLNQP